MVRMPSLEPAEYSTHGFVGVGKRSLLNRFAYDKFFDICDPTIEGKYPFYTLATNPVAIQLTKTEDFDKTVTVDGKSVAFSGYTLVTQEGWKWT